MNMLVLSRDPAKAAEYHCDMHVKEMIEKTAQLLSSVFTDSEYRSAHVEEDNPTCIWVKSSFENFCWLLEHALALCSEYTYRFGGHHPAEEIIEWCETGLVTVEAITPSKGITPFPQSLPDDVRHRNPVRAYRNYYNKYLRANARWTKRNPPEWWGVSC